MKLLLAFAVLLHAAPRIQCLSGGAPIAACADVSPSPGQHGAQPQTSPVPYSLGSTSTLFTQGYVPGQEYTITLTGDSGQTFRGFFVQSRLATDNSFIQATFSVTTNAQLRTCGGIAGSAVTHTNAMDKTTVGLRWTAPAAGTGPIIFRFAVVQVQVTYWANQATAVVAEIVPPPTINTQPTDLNVDPGQDAMFMVAATGVSLSYQWQRDGVDINDVADQYSGTTTAALTVITAQEADEGSFTCVVANSGGTVTSASASLTVTDITPPVINTQPVDVNVNPGQDATFTVAATGFSLSYQWQRDSVDINNIADQYSGTTTGTLTVITAQEVDEGSFTCVVSNSAGTVTSESASLTVTDIDTEVTTQPIAQTDVVPGEDVTFSVAATSANALSYQWQRNFIDLMDSADTYSGVTTSTLTVLSVAESNEGSFRCRITTSVGSVFSDAAELTVLDVPEVSTQPGDQANVDVGANVTFTVTATSTNLTYQWQKDGANIADTADTYSGTTTRTLVVITVEEEDEGTFRCVITNAAGSVTSDGAELTVGPDPTTVTTPAGATRATVLLSLTVVLLLAAIIAGL